MMRKLFYLGTGLFWLAILAFWTESRTPPSAVTPAAPAQPQHTIPLTEVARHSSAEDCWMAIDGQVYDLTAYLPAHPSKPSVIVPWCGREASEAYRTKTKGRPHSPEADQLLRSYRIGRLTTAPEQG